MPEIKEDFDSLDKIAFRYWGPHTAIIERIKNAYHQKVKELEITTEALKGIIDRNDGQDCVYIAEEALKKVERGIHKI